MVKKILIGLFVLAAIFAVIVEMQSPEFNVTRTATIAAPPEKVFPLVNNLKNWDSWSPWAKLDPSATNNFEGPEEGTGAKMSWAGNADVGIGLMTITESTPNELVRFELDFKKPMKQTNLAEFTFKADGANTVVIWSMSGHKNFIAKAMGLVFNCERMVGDQFDQGLASMKTIAETP
jgi:uncharacterized protein YndB with AHSA1/START domain